MKQIASFLFCLVLLSSCGGRRTDGSSASESELWKGVELLRTVPSDAAAAFCFEDCSIALEMMLKPGDALRGCIPDRLSKAPVTVSWCFNGNVVPLLSIAAPKDTNALVREVLQNAGNSGIAAAYLSDLKVLSGKGLLLLSPSESMVESAVRHVNSGASLLDAKGFSDALAKAQPGAAVVFWNNSAAAKWLDRKWVPEVFTRSELVSFIQGAAEWTVVAIPDVENLSSAVIRTSRGSSDSWMCNLLESMEPSDTRLASVLPSGTTFAVSLILDDYAVFREAYVRYLDASVRLTRYQNACADLKKKRSLSPEDWEKQNAFKEVTRVCWNGREVLLARPAKSSVAFKTKTNSRPGYLGVLYGKAFSLADESAVANIGRWLVIGSRQDVDAFAAVRERMDASLWPSKPCRFVLMERRNDKLYLLSSDPQGYHLNVY